MFIEWWERDVNLESLSRRRREARFGWINQPELINFIQISRYFDDWEWRYESGKKRKNKNPGRLTISTANKRSRSYIYLAM
jgi:hypothetical protein